MSNKPPTHKPLVSFIVIVSGMLLWSPLADARSGGVTDSAFMSGAIGNSPAWTTTGSSESADLGNPTASADAPMGWEQVDPRPPRRGNHALAYDSVRGRVVLFGGSNGTRGLLADTWEWDGTDWMNVTPAVSPSGRRNYALAYDSARGRVVLFGGINETGGLLADTWEWDGTAWENVTPAVSPSARFNHALAYDSARGCVVLFGGSGGGYLADTWEWDGISWAVVTPAVSPPARGNHALAYDSARGLVVLFGGTIGGGNNYADTWEWDGTAWVDVTPAVSPPASMYRHVMAYDSARGRVLLFGGSSGLWEWDGTEWVNVTPAASLPVSGPVAYDSARDRVVLFGGRSGGSIYYSADTWEWDGTDWVNVTPAVSPPARAAYAMAYDSARGRVVVFGGVTWRGGLHADTWEWDGTAWEDVTPAVSPSARFYHGLAYDSARGRVVLFGGVDGTPALLADTWEWDGAEWENVTPAVSPSGRGHALAYDSARGRVVLFTGGTTWEWDGIEWVDVTPAVSPPGRAQHDVVYDSARGRVVLFGGCCSSGGVYFADTWEWDGTEWEDVTPAVSPSGRGWHDLTYDSARGRVVLFGGCSSDPNVEIHHADTWEWDGTEWVDVTPAVSPPERGWHAMAYDSRRGRVVMMGGSDENFQALPDTWEYGPLLEKVCDDLDDNGNGLIDEGCDDDEDGYCDANMMVVGLPLVCSNGLSDCDDADASVYPGAPQVCDGLNNDCDHPHYPALTGTNEFDDDGDGFSECSGDCDDGRPWISPEIPEACDGLDTDCDGVIPADEVDADGDGHFPICGAGTDVWDCDDADATVYSGAPQVCDGLNNDCDHPHYPALTGTNESDDDGDGFSGCSGDCDDTQAIVYPGAPEICDSLDNDCDGAVDEEPYCGPLEGSPAWTAEGESRSAHFGESVAAAGDVNGDGYGDVIVGAWLHENGHIEEGAAYLYLSSASGLSVTPDWTVEGDQTGAHLGYSVASAGDVNGDGYSDVFIGASGYTNEYFRQGGAFLYLGSASGISATPDWTSEGDQPGAYFGLSVAAAGDVNADGYSDVIIGAPGYTSAHTQQGGVFVYLGSATGLSTTPDWTAEGDGYLDHFGQSVASAGDVNGDGYSDVIVGNDVYWSGRSGSVYVYLGSAAGLEAVPAWQQTEPVVGEYGHSVSTAGDVNGDGYSDIIVGQPSFGGGTAYVYLGSASGPSSAPDWILGDDYEHSRFGWSVATAGDVNGDGYGDVIIGALQYWGKYADGGRSTVYLGSPSGLRSTPAWTMEGDQANARFGTSVATAGDINGDGLSDVIIGAPYHPGGSSDLRDRRGRAYVYLGIRCLDADGDGFFECSGDCDDTQATVYPAAPQICDGLNNDCNHAHYPALTGTNDGDDDGDGLTECSGDCDDTQPAIYPAAPQICDGLNNDCNHAYYPALTGTNDGDDDGDGFSECGGDCDDTQATVYPGAPQLCGDGLNNDCIHPDYPALTGTNESDDDGDGFSECSGDCDDTDPATSPGSPEIPDGRNNDCDWVVDEQEGDPLEHSPSWIATSELDAVFGYSVSSAGDVNGDGYDDVIVGAIDDYQAQSEDGAFLYLGSASGPSVIPDWVTENIGGEFGTSVGGAGDVNGDGYDDVIVGAPKFYNGQVREGVAFLYLGSPSGLSATPDWTAEIDQRRAYFGQSVATAGDVNGDGYDDVIVGAPRYENGQQWEGAAFVYLGSASGPSATPDWIAEGDRGYAYFGASLATAGDVNGDGFSDVIMGESSYYNGQYGEGRALVFHGSRAGLSNEPKWTAESDKEYAAFGGSVATAGDVNGDGYDDVIVGADGLYNEHGIRGGGAFLYLGSASGLEKQPHWAAQGDQRYVFFGRSVATAGDVDADGYSDVIIGAPRYPGPETMAGRVYVYRGSSSGLSMVPDWLAEGDHERARFGWRVTTAGDVDGDGADDVMIAAPSDPAYEGRALVFLGIPCSAVGCDLDTLIAYVENLDTTNQAKNGLLGKLGEARKALDRGDTAVAVNKLQDFRDQVAGQAGNAISQSDAEYLDACAAETIERIEGPCH